MTNNTPNPADLRRTILEQVKLDQEAFARLSPVKQRACINELRSIGYNPSVEFPANPTLVEGSDR